MIAIVHNNRLLNQTIQQATQFANGKENFIVFGTGGSNLGAKALINILQGRERNNIIFHDNLPLVVKFLLLNVTIIKLSKNLILTKLIARLSN